MQEAEAALRRLAPDLPPDAAVLLRRLFADVPGPELAGIPSEAVAEAAASLFAFARERPPGEAKLRVLPPGPGRGPHAVVEIVTDDMPFLVDSALGALARQGRVVRQLLHPIVAVRRDGAGRLLSLGGTVAEGTDAAAGRESMMRITVGAAQVAMLPGQGTGGWPELERLLARAMADVRLAVADYPAMVRLLHAAEEEIAAAPREGEPAAAAAFLRWMADENFVLIGHRRLDIGERGALAVAAGENLGLLRDPAVPVFDALRDTASLVPAMREALVAPVPLSVAKANMRSTVHRPQHADVVATRLFDADGRVSGLRLFLGLFAAAAYNRNPRSIPMLSQKVDRVLALAGFDPDAHDGRALRDILDTWPRDELFQAPEAAILAGALQGARPPDPAAAGVVRAARPVRALRFRDRLAAARGLRHPAPRTRRRDAGAGLSAGASARSTSRSATRRSPASSTSSAPTRRARARWTRRCWKQRSRRPRAPSASGWARR